MRFGRLIGTACLALAAAAAYGIYEPDVAERWAPPVGALAQQLHAKLWTTPGRTGSNSAPGQSDLRRVRANRALPRRSSCR